MVEAPREAFGHALVELGRENPDIVVLDADLASSTRVTYFAQEFPERFFQMGVAEQNMVGVAAGMALKGKIPFVSTFAVFASRRACDQVAISVAHCGLNVKLVAAYSGIVSGNNGATHQAVEDVGIMRAIPHMTIVDPADDIEMGQALRAIVAYDGPVYLRVTRDAWPRVSPEGYAFELGKAVEVREGSDVTLVGSGMMPAVGIHHRNKYNPYCLADDVMEPYRPFVDSVVINIMEKEGGVDELTTEIKQQLLSIPAMDIVIDKEKSPLMVGLRRTTASLMQCFEGKTKKIMYPEL